MMMRVVMTALLGLSLLASSPAAACPRCDDDSLARSLVAGSYVNFQQITRTLRVRVTQGEDEWEDRIVVVGGVRPEKDGERVSWSDLERGASLELEVHETEQSRYVVRVKVVG